VNDSAQKLIERFAIACNITPPHYSIVDKAGEKYLAIHVGRINEIYAQKLSEIKEQLRDTNDFADRVFLKPSKPESWLRSLECQLLQRLLAQSLTVGKSTLQSEYHQKFIPFVGGEERQIYSETNHVVFGRRGAGKSSLVLYACNCAKRDRFPFAWIALQQYRRRDDLLVVPQVLYEVVDALAEVGSEDLERIKRLRNVVYGLEEKGADLTKKHIDVTLPVFARDFLPFVRRHSNFYIFLDDLHLLHPSIQPYVLSAIYSFSRGNNVHLKITAIENLTHLFDDKCQEGLQTPGDAQVMRLDYNLVNPHVAFTHIDQILTSYVRFVGIPSLSSLCGNNVKERLVWVSAGVPRDALYIFNNAITKAIAADRKTIAVMDINMAAADSLTEKERFVSDDVAEDATEVLRVVSDIKDFCLKEIRCNAFLAHIDTTDDRYKLLKKVSDLRFIHVLHPGITPEKAGEKYEALMLDYAFYTGFRKAQSVTEFKSQPEQPRAKELRKLNRYRYEDRLQNVGVQV
jgi:hypothetical protein